MNILTVLTGHETKVSTIAPKEFDIDTLVAQGSTGSGIAANIYNS